ncbi:winged helix-turn-helix domain-containing protein [Erwinia amylovora]|uniref:winged helix-turn-helix domain-containing protein n=1 Tax=Erwinia amylovora TaxID=552 RepID=UPI001F04133F|nr:winged helix-turn-helix domain-containing protein [Erwinia amylovora]
MRGADSAMTKKLIWLVEKMNYIINHNLCFDSLNGLLKLTDNSDSTLQLSRPGTRLLTELIIHAGEIITREDLIKKVWEDHDLTPSGSNLSNHISLLRKAFSQLAVTEIMITTIPKVGFRLDAVVSVEKSIHRQSGFIITNLKALLAPLNKKKKL